MIKLHDIKNVYFVGVGGIGMSALARYFNMLGKNVAGYDRTQTELTNTLIDEGISICFSDNKDNIPENFYNKNTLVVFTPAIPNDNKILKFFKRNEYLLKKEPKF